MLEASAVSAFFGEPAAAEAGAAEAEGLFVAVEVGFGVLEAEAEGEAVWEALGEAAADADDCGLSARASAARSAGP